eukprot:5209758-Karenia_brevis.AAC.1
MDGYDRKMPDRGDIAAFVRGFVRCLLEAMHGDFLLLSERVKPIRSSEDGGHKSASSDSG